MNFFEISQVLYDKFNIRCQIFERYSLPNDYIIVFWCNKTNQMKEHNISKLCFYSGRCYNVILDLAKEFYIQIEKKTNNPLWKKLEGIND